MIRPKIIPQLFIIAQSASLIKSGTVCPELASRSHFGNNQRVCFGYGAFSFGSSKDSALKRGY
ncbi:MAG: hypothetical protein ABIK93_09885 [candidate division WOR-3 bacterium]